MSVTLTEQAVVERRKTETRRLGWLHATPGQQLELCRKVMGRKRSDGTVEPLVRLARVEIVEVRRERLDAITDAAVAREGFNRSDLEPWIVGTPAFGPGVRAAGFVRFFCEHMRCTPSTELTVIRWRYLD